MELLVDGKGVGEGEGMTANFLAKCKPDAVLVQMYGTFLNTLTDPLFTHFWPSGVELAIELVVLIPKIITTSATTVEVFDGDIVEV